METITIENVGPIKGVENLELNKVNVFIGPQSSGKSTIAKIISFCSWVEKKYIRDGLSLSLSRKEHYADWVRFEDLIKYHRLVNGYFSAESSFHYQGEQLSISRNTTTSITQNGLGIGMKMSGTRYNSKVQYIPAERNFVAVIPNLKKYAEERDSIQGFIDNWYEAKRKYDTGNPLDILKMGVRYYTHEDMDRLYLDKEGKEISLQIASSGLQSVVPLVTLADYTLRGIYNESRPMSVSEQDELAREYNKMVHQKQKNNDSIDSKDLEMLLNLILSKNYVNTKLIIEEPEQNLFPSTQRDLVYHLLQLINGERDHRLTITTHSPYILYALNNCMMAGLVYDKMRAEDQAKIKCQYAKIDPSKVSIYEIKEGYVDKIQRKNGLISSNYFDRKMKELMDDFYVMLNYYA